jgi:hypothetical protein
VTIDRLSPSALVMIVVKESRVLDGGSRILTAAVSPSGIVVKVLGSVPVGRGATKVVEETAAEPVWPGTGSVFPGSPVGAGIVNVIVLAAPLGDVTMKFG